VSFLCGCVRRRHSDTLLERILAQTERPADIVRRRLEQAGYDESDGQDLLGGAGLSFLLKFVYKSLFLGPAVRFHLSSTSTALTVCCRRKS
jgi:hypothetical protein